MISIICLAVACVALSVTCILLSNRVSRLEKLASSLYDSIPKF